MKYFDGINGIKFTEVIELYNSVGWSTYTKNSEDLKIAFQNSTHITYCLNKNKLIGLARSISDGLSIHYLQDILVSPDNQGNGIGKCLLQRCLKKFKNVRTHMILTDNEEKQKKFYESLGYKNTKDLKEIILNSYVKMDSISLV